MNYSVELSKEAVVSIKKASDYYLEISTDLKDDFVKELSIVIDEIKEHPLRFQIRYRGVRIGHTKRFQFGVHFIVENKTIFVLQVLHHKMFYK